MPASIHDSIETQATCHFLSNYVLLPRDDHAEGFLEFVIPLIGANHRNPSFHYAFHACALLSLSRRARDSHHLRTGAFMTYNKALIAMRGSLQKLHASTCEAILASAFLLSLFETIAGQALACRTHAQGLAELLNRAMTSKLLSSDCRSLKTALISQIVMHALTSGITLPMDDPPWFSSEPSSQCQRLCIQVAQMGPKIDHFLIDPTKTGPKVAKMEEMLQECRELDNELLLWSKNLPQHYAWRSVAWASIDSRNADTSSNDEAFPGEIHVYSDLWVSGVWNIWRCARLILASKMIRCAAWLAAPADYRTRREYALFASTCTKLITHIISCIPYQMSWYTEPSATGFACGEVGEDSQNSLAGFFSLYPLACVYSHDCTTDTQRRWVQGRLEYVSARHGVEYAGRVAHLSLRFPSMLIARDRLLAGIEQLRLETLDSSPSQTENSNRHGLRKAISEHQLEDLVSRVSGPSGLIHPVHAKALLQLPNSLSSSP
ncbi:hypothetical protein QQS21_000083 [Conoideocrella luteorostrata]|uniref:Uncharacterized protein n=1 Tax=Conoideocrella luteorostrata TaxID=1105319 RepID=A0AAJ0D227_9HYPO|nr:hypothetical protein QQS21_000083 [Conoideocrella luteorostrata]